MVFMLSVVMLNVIVLSVVMLNVVSPSQHCKKSAGTGYYFRLPLVSYLVREKSFQPNALAYGGNKSLGQKLWLQCIFF